MPLGKIVGKGRIFFSQGAASSFPCVQLCPLPRNGIQRASCGSGSFSFDEACRQAAARGLGEKALLELGRQQQVASLFEDGRAKVLAGETSPEEMLRVLGPLEKK